MNAFTLVAVACALLGATASAGDSSSRKKHKDQKVMCYFGSWATYRSSPGTCNVEDIDPMLCTHVLYAFAGLNSNNWTMTSLDPYNDLETDGGKGSFKKFTALSQNYTHLKTILGIGGWNQGSENYSTMASEPAYRESFAKSAVEFLVTYAFDGLDLNWEYPTLRGGRPEDKENLVLLLKELNRVLKRERKREGKEEMWLSISVSANQSMIGVAYDAKGISRHVDMVGVMTYDYYTSSSSNRTAPIAPLCLTPDGWSVGVSMRAWMTAGVPSHQLLVGMHTYGQSYTLRDPTQNGLWAPSSGPGTAGPATQEAGILAWYETCALINNASATVAKEDCTTYAYLKDQWVTDSQNDIPIKTRLVKELGLAGVMVWAIDLDAFSGQCGGSKYPLLTAINKGLGRL